MDVKRVFGTVSACVICFSLTALPCAALAESAGQLSAPTDEDRFDGDHLWLRSNVYGFSESGKADPIYCAPQGSTLRVLREATDGTLYVQFYEIPQRAETARTLRGQNVTQAALDACPDPKKTADPQPAKPSSTPDPQPAKPSTTSKSYVRVNLHTTYQINKAELQNFGFKRSGITFGMLIVPFKFRLGGDRAVTPSSSIAPYVGFRTHRAQGFGLTFTPILAAGLGMVPITDPAENKTVPKPALTLATGLVMTSSKNEKFNAGLVFGKDVLSKSDQALDPNVDKWWLSFYVGIAIK